MTEVERAQDAAKTAFDARPTSPLRAILTPTPPPTPSLDPMRVPLMPTPAPEVSLTDQWLKLEGIEQELRRRIRRERLAISAAYDKQVVEINQETDRKVEEALMKLESERHALLQALAATTAEKLREHELLAKRMSVVL